VLARESLLRHVETLKRKLAGEHPALIEELLVSQVSMTWLAVCHAEAAAAGPQANVGQVALSLRRAESAQRRHMLAVKTLVSLRALVPSGLVPGNTLKLVGESRKLA
jgi:hypothetical protein